MTKLPKLIGYTITYLLVFVATIITILIALALVGFVWRGVVSIWNF